MQDTYQAPKSFPIRATITLGAMIDYENRIQHLQRELSLDVTHDPAACAVSAAIREAVPGAEDVTASQELVRFKLGGVWYEGVPPKPIADVMTFLDQAHRGKTSPPLGDFTIDFVPLDVDDPAESALLAV